MIKSADIPILELINLSVIINLGQGQKLYAVSGVCFHIDKGETLGLVGESGCGKSSVARAIMQLPGPTSGEVLFWGKDLTKMTRKELQKIRPRFQMVFQDSVSALNPRRKIVESIARPLKSKGSMNKQQRILLARKMMASVGLDPEFSLQRPHQFSGGQCQRIQIARALITKPCLIICDEPVSSLDVSIQAQIINLLEKMRKQYKLTMLFISHDLSVIKNVCDRVAVMYLGKICEIAPSQQLYQSPAHPYTAALLSAIPEHDPTSPPKKLKMLKGEIPSPTAPPSGCSFRTRCPSALECCTKQEPRLREIGPQHKVACHLRNSF
ncbi:MAG: ATP-binding cassette domain-containing protein [Desulfobacteraceae bacterium]|nr:ATP-binding cassette domain-containing protein [Desulfobacteraceae bacterium]